jgi:hypothetical protein
VADSDTIPTIPQILDPTFREWLTTNHGKQVLPDAEDFQADDGKSADDARFSAARARKIIRLWQQWHIGSK